MPTIIDTKAYIIGAADVYYRDIGVNTAWNSVGATLDDATMRVVSEWFRPDNIAGVRGPVQGLDVLRRCSAEIEFTLPELAGSKFGLAFPGSRVTAAVNADAGGSPLNTTTTAAVAAGATSLALTSATNAAVGDWFRIEAGASPIVEYRQITEIASLVISFRDPLLFGHASGAAVVETSGDNRQLIEAPFVARPPDSAYKEWALVVASGRGYHELRMPRAISQTDTAEITIGDATLSGIRCTIGSRLNPANLTESPFRLYSPA